MFWIMFSSAAKALVILMLEYFFLISCIKSIDSVPCNYIVLIDVLLNTCSIVVKSGFTMTHTLSI